EQLILSWPQGVNPFPADSRAEPFHRRYGSRTTEGNHAMTQVPQRTDPFPLRICVQSRECSTAMMERLGSMLFPERPIGAAIVSALHRPSGWVICVTGTPMADARDQIGYFVRLGMATTEVTDPRPPRQRVTVLSIDDWSSRWLSEKLMDTGNPKAADVRAYL